VWSKVEAAIESIAASVGVFAQLAVLLAWTMAKVLAITFCGAIIIGVPLVAGYRWSGGSAVRYTVAAAVVIGALIYVPNVLLRWHRKSRARSAQRVMIRRAFVPLAGLSLLSAAVLQAQSVPVAPGTRFGIWTFAASSDSGEAAYFVDLSNAKRTLHGRRVRAWMKLLHADLQPLPPALRTTAANWNGETTFRYLLLYADFDCTKNEVRSLAFYYFDDHGRTVSALDSRPTEAWMAPPPETTLGQVLDIACAR